MFETKNPKLDENLKGEKKKILLVYTVTRKSSDSPFDRSHGNPDELLLFFG